MREEFREEFEGYLARLRANDPTLTELDIGQNEIGDDGAAALARALQGNRTLTELVLTGNRIGVAGAEFLAEALLGNTTLTGLYLGGNEIGDDGAEALARALGENETLTELDLWINEITDAGAEFLAQALLGNTTITRLGIGYNRIGSDGAESLARALRGNRTLTKLSLLRSQIGDAGARAIAGALRGNTTLTELYLGSNEIGDDGTKALAEALKVNATLDALDLSGNQPTDVGAMALAQAVRENKALTKLYLVGVAGARDIEASLKHAKTNKKMFSKNLFGEAAQRYHDLNKLSEENPVLPPEIYLTIVKDFLSAILLVRGSIAEKLNLIEMSNLKDLKLPNKDESAYLIAKAFEKFTQGVEGRDVLGAEVVRPICASDSVLLEGFEQLYDYDERLGNGIIFLQESEEAGRKCKTATTTPFNQVRVDLDTLSRMLTKDVEKSEEEKEYKTIRGQQVEIEGLDFAQIVKARRPILLLNIFRIAEGVPSLMTAFEEKMQANGGALLNIVEEMMPSYPALQGRLQQVVDRVGKITEITEDEASTTPEVSVAASEAKPPSSPLLPKEAVVASLQLTRNVRDRTS